MGFKAKTRLRVVNNGELSFLYCCNRKQVSALRWQAILSISVDHRGQRAVRNTGMPRCPAIAASKAARKILAFITYRS